MLAYDVKNSFCRIAEISPYGVYRFIYRERICKRAPGLARATNPSRDQGKPRIGHFIQRYYPQRVFTMNLPITDILTVDQVTEMYGLSRSTVYAWVHENRVPHYKPSQKMLYFKQSEIEEYLLSNRIPSRAEIETEANTKLLLSRGDRK